MNITSEDLGGLSWQDADMCVTQDARSKHGN
jgi:hypothetical protein